MSYSKETIAKLDQKTAAFRKKVQRSVVEDRQLALPDDEPLTKEEIAEIDRFWEKYRFAYPDIDYKSYETFKNRYGTFDVHHLPNNVRKCIFTANPDWRDDAYFPPFRNKTLFDYLFPDVEKPVTIARRMKGICYDSNYNPISINALIDICVATIEQTKSLVFKPGGAKGGSGIVFLEQDEASSKRIRDILTKDMKGLAVVVQKPLEQSAFMAAFNGSSVNTIRLTTLLLNDTVHCLSATIRFGSPGSKLDNYHSGGGYVGVDLQSGTCRNSALMHNLSRASVLPSGLDLREPQVIPHFDSVKQMGQSLHLRMPYARLIGWDIALNHDDNPVFIEANYGPGMTNAWSVNGAIYKDCLEELLDKYLLQDFSLQFATEDFMCREFYDHVEIIDSAETGTPIPDSLRGKPVTKVTLSERKEQKAM